MKRFQAGGATVGAGTSNFLDEDVANKVGQESSLSNWAGKYVTGMLGKGAALGDRGYETYTGPLSAGESGLQTQGYQGLAGLSLPTSQMGTFKPSSFTAAGTAQKYMNPYLDTVLAPQIAEQQRQAEIARVKNAARMTNPGGPSAFGGGRQGVQEGVLQGEMLRNIGDIYGKEYGSAYTSGLGQFNKEQAALSGAQGDVNDYGFNILDALRTMGGEQREIDAEGILADKTAFEEERDFDYNQVKWMSSLLDSLPIAAQSYSYEQPSGLSNLMGGVEGVKTIWDLLGISGSGGGGASNAWTPEAQAAFGSYYDSYFGTGMSSKDAAEQAMRDLGIID